MKPNVGNIDRILRFLAGFTLLGAGYYFKSWWGLVGIVPLLTATFRFCPVYLTIKLNTGAPSEDKK